MVDEKNIVPGCLCVTKTMPNNMHDNVPIFRHGVDPIRMVAIREQWITMRDKRRAFVWTFMTFDGKWVWTERTRVKRTV